MFAEKRSIQIHLRHGTSGLKIDEGALVLLPDVGIEVLPVPPRSAVIRFPLLCLLPSPVVRKINRLPCVIVKLRLLGTGDIAKCESPIRIDRRVLLRTTRRYEERQTCQCPEKIVEGLHNDTRVRERSRPGSIVIPAIDANGLMQPPPGG